MKTIKINLSLWVMLLFAESFTNLYSQLPKVDYADYSTQSGTFTDPRDGKVYAYKNYNGYDWFMQNLNRDAENGKTAPDDSTGEKYGRFYNTSVSNKSLCPEGWFLATKNDWAFLFDFIAEEYKVADLKPKNNNNWTIFNAAYYLRAGGKAPEGLWTTGNIAPQANQIQFNILPSGEFNGSGYVNGKAPGSTAVFLIGGNERYYTALETNSSSDNYHANIRHDETSDKWGSVRCVRFNDFPDCDEENMSTPYPAIIELKQINGAEKERIRLAQGHKKFEQQPTGFYVEKGREIAVNIEQITPSSDGMKPVLTVGTLGLIDNTPTSYELSEGENIISGHNGGLIFLSYITANKPEPVGKVRVTFTGRSKHVRAPHYIHGITSDEEFACMLGKYETPNVIFESDYAIVAATRANALAYSIKEDLSKWMESILFLLAVEDNISGLDDNDPNPIHHRMKPNEVRYLLCENANSSPHADSAGYTGYPSSSVNRYLTYSGIYDTSWMMGHEIGHQHQQPAYLINLSTESTVNIYAYVVERTIQQLKGNSNYNRTSADKWNKIRQSYLKLPVEQRVYNMDDAELERLSGGIEKNEVRFMPWEQLFLLFGDDFYKVLHRVIRDEKKVNNIPEQDRRLNLIWKSSQITGYDMREFFNQWGIRVTGTKQSAELNQYFDEALENGSIIALPQSIEKILNVTGQNRPAWTPIALRGIEEGIPPVIDADNIALDKSVIASGQQIGGGNSNYAFNLTDGDFGTRWASSNASFPQWVEIDLEKEYNLEQIDIHWVGSDNDTFTNRWYQYTISTATNDKNYERVIDRSNNRTAGLISEKINKTARYIKINISGAKYADSGSAYTINSGMWEVQVYGSPFVTIPLIRSFSGLFHVVNDGTTTRVILNEPTSEAEMNVFDISGKRIISKQIHREECLSLPQGVYIIQLKNEQSDSEIQKFIVK
ncbi:MAG: M60 family metallopeptidase [Dysgonamonadaceae bacterium]|jgi:uncharacterized protein (TIGR02145 family)|nr:M60 family metallopeptidase [Dysgonamonadaceae bacterium]